MLKIILIFLVSIFIAYVIIRVMRKDLIEFALLSLVITGIGLYLLAPAGVTSSLISSDNIYGKVLKCEHCDDISDVDTSYFCQTSIYTNNLELFILAEQEPSYIVYCARCYNADTAREYYNKHKNSTSAFVN